SSAVFLPIGVSEPNQSVTSRHTHCSLCETGLLQQQNKLRCQWQRRRFTAGRTKRNGFQNAAATARVGTEFNPILTSARHPVVRENDQTAAGTMAHPLASEPGLFLLLGHKNSCAPGF